MTGQPTLATERVASLDDFELYRAARRVADIVFEYVAASAGTIQMGDRRHEKPNPAWTRTSSGLFLELYCGAPSSLWTPWGQYTFCEGGSFRADALEKLLPKLLDRLGAELYLEQSKSGYKGPYGDVYALHRVDDQPLPPPVELAQSAFVGRPESRGPLMRAWDELTRRFEAQTG